MQTPKVNGTKVIFGPCRLSYTHVFQKYAQEGSSDDGSYQTNILIPKNEVETIKAIKAAIEEAKRIGKDAKWHGTMPAVLDVSFRDGDLPKRNGTPRDEEYHGHYFMNAKCKTKPGIIDKFGNPITDEEEIYSGVWCICSVTFFAFSRNGNFGVSCGLNNLMKFKDDDRFGGRVSAQSDFAGFINVNDDDDM